MFKNKIFIFIILVVVLLSIGVASAADDSGAEVVTSAYDGNTSLDVVSRDNIETSNEDVKTFNSFSNENTESGNDATFSNILASDKTTPKSFTELNNTINSASDIKLDSNYKMTADEAGNFTNGIIISKDITIEGNGFTIDANKLGRIFNINAGYTVSLTNVTLANGSSGEGGAIYNNAGLTLTNVTFVNNFAESDGGAIFNMIDGLTVGGCTFINNIASCYGGAIYNSGAAGFNVGNSNFADNSAGEGDAIYSDESCIANDNWWGNNTPDWTGLVTDNVIHDTYAVLNLVSNNNNEVVINFYRNGTADVLPISRDVIFNIGDENFTGRIVDGTFKQEYVAPAPNYFITASADNEKIAIKVINYVYVDYENGNDTKEGSSWNESVKTIAKALELVQVNGRIYLADGIHVANYTVSIDKTVTIVGNGTKTLITNNKNGARVFHVSADNVAIYNCTFIDNSGYDGGAVFNRGVGLIVCNSIFINNTSNNGGAIYSWYYQVTCVNCTFINNSATEYGGATYNQYYDNIYDNCTFINNTASTGGGAIYNIRFTGSYDGRTTNCIFINNSATYGGVIYNGWDSDFIIDNCIFINNSATYGGVIYSYRTWYADGEILVTNSTFINNNASEGGVIYNYNDRDCTIRVVIGNSSFINNTVTGGGEVVYTWNSGSVVANDNWWGDNNPNFAKLISGNSANTYDTYAILNLTVNTTSVDINFYRNGTTEVLPFSRNLNLSIADKNINGKIVNGTFTTEYAAISGEYSIIASVDNEKLTVNLTNNDIYVNPDYGNDENNGASWSAAVQTIAKAMKLVPENGRIYLADGIYLVNTFITVDKTVTIVGNGSKTVITNEYNNDDGVFYVTADNVSIYNCTFVNNSAEYGGAIYNIGADFRVSGCTFINSTASCYGGAIYNSGAAGFNVSNSNFVDNIAGEGDAIYSDESFIANDNWWGNNTPDWTGLVTDNVIHDTYAVLNLVSNNNNEVVINFYRNGTADVLPISRDVIFTIGDENFTGKIVDGTFKQEYVAPAPNYVVTASADNEKIAIKVINYVYVDYENGNDTRDGSSWNEAVKTIAKALELVPANGRIYLADGIHVATYMLVDKGVTIIGNGSKTVITTKNGGKIFHLYASGISLYNCTFANNTGEDGAVFSSVVYAYVANCIFINNSASGKGGAIYSWLQYTEAFNCTFINNSADCGGATFNQNYGDIFDNCTFINNTANAGGAIYNLHYLGSPDGRTTNCIFINNSATSEGGAIYNGWQSDFVIDNCTFVNNSAGNYGGVIFGYGNWYNDGEILVTNSIFINNSAVAGGVIYDYNSLDDRCNFYIKLDNCSFINNKGNGSVVYTYGSSSSSGLDNVVVNNSIFMNNSGKYGGVFYNYLKWNCLIDNSTFMNNNASWGGVIYNYNEHGDSKVVVGNSSFINNSVTGGGGVVYTWKPGCSVVANDNWWGDNNPNFAKLISGNSTNTHDTYAILNLTVNTTSVDIDFYRNGTTDVLPFSRNLNLSIGNITITDRIVNGAFKQDYVAPAHNYVVTASVDNEKLAINIVNYVYVDPVNGKDDNDDYDGFSWDSPVQSISKAMSIVQANGRIYLSDGTHIVKDTQITIGNTVTIIGNGTKTFITNNKNGYGVFKVTAGDVAIYNCSFVNNTATLGGAIYVGYGVSGVAVSGCTFVNNSAEGSSGGAILNGGSGLTVNNCSFVNNSAKYGGVIYNYGSGVTVSNCSFVNNSASSGGAIYNCVYGLTVTNSVFVNNTANNGDSIYSESYCNANDNWWGTNTLNWGGLVYGSVTHDTYAVLNLTATDDNITLKFYRNGTNEVLPFSRDLSLTIGNQPATSNKIVNGTFETDYVISAIGEYVIKANVDNQELTVKLTNNNVYVDPVKGSDTDNTGASWDSPFKTIQHAMDEVPANGNIYLSDGTHKVDSQITINKAVTIIGNGTKTIVTTNKTDRVFTVSASNVAIYNSTFANNSASYGGAIEVSFYVTGVTVSGCTFVNNSASYGGAIEGCGSLTVSDCTFVNNTASYMGGAIYVDYACSSFTVNNCSFINNTAKENGGAIFNYCSGFTASNCSFINNTAKENGGAIYNSGTSGSTISNSKFENNDATKGAAIYNNGYEEYYKATISLNDNTYFGIREGKTYIYNAGTLASPVNITVLGNKTVKAHPGETITLTATVTCDGASVAGGTLKFFIDGEEYECDVTSNDDGNYTCEYPITYFEGSKVISASYAEANEVSVKNATLKYSIETFADLKNAMEYTDIISITSDVELADGESFPDGIAISKDLTINGNGFTIDANQLGRIFNITAGAVNLNNITLANGKTTGDGGAIINNGTLTLTNVTLTNNTAEGKGDAIYNLGTLSLNNNKYSGVTKDKIYVYNNGTIASCVITVLESKTVNKYYGEEITLFATVTCDGASVTGGTLYFTINNDKYEAINQNNGSYAYDYKINFSGEKIVNAIYKNADANYVTVKNAILNVSKYNPKVNVTIDETKFGQDLNITVQLPEDTKGNVTIIVDGITYNKTIENGNVDLAIKNLGAGLHGIIVKYPGSEKYLDDEVIKFVNISKVEATLTVDIKDISYGGVFTIEATLTGINTPLNGNVIVTINNKNYTVSIKDGKGKLEISDKLPANTYQFTANWYGDDNYSKTDFTDSFKIAQINPTLTIEGSDIYVGENETIKFNLPDDATGTVTIKVGNYSNTVSVDEGKDIIVNLKAGNYTAAVTYNGDNNYNSITKEYNFTVSKNNPDIYIISYSEWEYGVEYDIIFSAPPDVTGNVSVSINGTPYTVELDSGFGYLRIPILNVGIYAVNITYNGNDKYRSVNSFKIFNVTPSNPNLNVIIDNGEYAKNSTIIATLTGANNTQLNGTVEVTIGKETYNITVTDGKGILNNLEFLAGDYNFTAIWKGSNNYNQVQDTGSFKIAKANPTFNVDVSDIFVGENETIKFNLPTDATGKVTVMVGNYSETLSVEEGMKVIANLKAGNYTAILTYSGDDNYNTVTKEYNFTVSKSYPAGDIIWDNIVYGSGNGLMAIFSIDAKGTITFNINGTSHILELNEGYAYFDVSNMDAGSYTFNATYSGDDKYRSVTFSNITFNVLPANPNLNVIIGNGEYNKNLTVVAALNGVNNTSLNGTVVVTINNKTYNVTVVDGKGISKDINLQAGDYNFTATWEGKNNYNPAQDTGSFNIARSNPTFNVDVSDIYVDEDEIIKFNLPTDATGNVTITVGNYSNTVSVDKGMDIIANLKAGNYTAIITYSGDDNYNSLTKEFNFTVSRSYPAGDILWNNIIYGSGNGLTAIFSIDAKGTVTFNINGTPHILELDDGWAYLDVSNMDAGSYTFNATYSGDNKYHSVYFSNMTFNILPANPSLNVIIDNVEYGKNSTIVATLNGANNTSLNGTVVVKINNKTYNVTVVDGKGISKEVTLPAGDYNFTAAWEGTNNYNPAQDTGSFKIAKINPTIDVISTDIYVGEDEVITVILPEDATGEVVITVDDVNYTVKVENGIAKQNITGLKTMDETSLTYLVHVKYLGDNNYNNITALDDEFTVYKVSSYDLNVTIPSDVKYGDNTTITVDVPTDATGNVTVSVDGENYTVKVENGTANITISPLSSGVHNITTTYNGDDKYNPITKQGNITIVLNDVNLTAENVVMIYKDGSRLIAILTDILGNPIANATLTFAINGREYNRTTDVNGSASIALNLESGEYNTTITYLGSKSYNPASVNTTVTITPSIIGEDIVKMYQNDTQFYAKFLDSHGNPLANTTVKFNINGVFYNRTTDANGTAKLNINLRPGNYTLTAYNPETGEQQGFNVLVKSLIEADDLTKYYNNESKFRAKFYNKDGSLAVNKSVTFNINGVFYTRQTDENGTVKLAINLRPSDYIITTIFEGLELSNNVKVLPTLITNDLSMNYKDGSKFNATVLDNQGNPLANQTVRFNVNGVFYNKISDENGLASLDINLNKGAYIITSYWKDYETGNKITIF